jgi:hypothetical protein
MTPRRLFQCFRCTWRWLARAGGTPTQCPRCQCPRIAEVKVGKDAICQAVAGERVGVIDAELDKAIGEAKK